MEHKHYAIANDGILDVGMVAYFPAGGVSVLIIRKKLDIKDNMMIKYDVLDLKNNDFEKDEYKGFSDIKAVDLTLSEGYMAEDNFLLRHEWKKGAEK